MHRKWIYLTTAIVLVLGLWTGGWFALRSYILGEMDKALVTMAGEGVTITCPERSLSGWPFRMELQCTGPVAEFPDGSRITTNRLAVIGVVSDPMLVVAVAEAPLKVTAADGTDLTGTFSSLKASLRIADMKPSRVSIAAEGVTLDASRDGETLSRVVADIAELHVRQSPEPDALDVATRFVKATVENAGQPALPFPADSSLAVTVRHFPLVGEATPADLARWSKAGGEIAITEASFLAGDAAIRANGTARVAATGYPEANITLTGDKLDWFTAEAKAGKAIPAALTSVIAAFGFLGKAGENGQRTMEVTVKDGVPSVGLMKLPFALPQLFSAEG